MSKSIGLFIYDANSEELILLGKDGVYIDDIENIKLGDNRPEK